MRYQLQNLIYYSENGQWGVTTDFTLVPSWDHAFVVTWASVVKYVPDVDTMQLLFTKFVLDPSLWALPCKDEDRRVPDMPTSRHIEWCEHVMTDFLAAAYDCTVAGVLDPVLRRRSRHRRRETDRGTESRFTDGLTAPCGRPATGSFYGPGYSSPQECLPFSLAVEDNPIGLVFDGRALQLMGRDTVMKVYELRRQRVTLSPLHIVPIYVYTYELDGETEQVCPCPPSVAFAQLVPLVSPPPVVQATMEYAPPRDT